MSEILRTDDEQTKNGSEWDILREDTENKAEKPARVEYLDIIEDLSDGITGEEELGVYSIEKMFGPEDEEKYASKSHEMQRAATIIDAEIIRRNSETALQNAIIELGKTPEDETEKREMLLSAREAAEERMHDAYVVAKRELRKAYPGVSDKEASKEFFGYESWAIEPDELSASVTNNKSYDKDGEEISTESNPDDAARVEEINRAIELRSAMHGPVYSDYLPSEVGIFQDSQIPAV